MEVINSLTESHSGNKFQKPIKKENIKKGGSPLDFRKFIIFLNSKGSISVKMRKDSKILGG
jgi:hypothetical protein